VAPVAGPGTDSLEALLIQPGFANVPPGTIGGPSRCAYAYFTAVGVGGAGALGLGSGSIGLCLGGSCTE
jgi:hypothetical protein